MKLSKKWSSIKEMKLSSDGIYVVTFFEIEIDAEILLILC